jgi:tetratricopeptide (TPR) repeat protein
LLTRTVLPALLYWALLATVATAAAQGAFAPATAEEAEALFAGREELAKAIAVADFWSKRLAANPRDFEAGWKLARVCYWLGDHVPQAERRERFEQGIEAARKAAAAQPNRPEGHFWQAANMGAMAEGFGMRAGLRYRGPIKESLEKALAIDPSYLNGSPDRVLGRWYARVPGLFGGSDTKAVEHLQRSLTYYPRSIASLFFLAETYVDMGRREDARQQFQAVIDAPFHPDWVPEEKEFKEKARAQLAKSR